MSDAINAISQECNISISNVLYNVPDTANNKTIAHIINEGVSAVVPAYQYCYNRANVAAIQVFRFNPLPTIDGIAIAIGNITGKNGRPSVLFTLAGMSPELVVATMNKYAGTSLTTSTLNPAGDTLSNPVFGYYYYSSTYLRLIITPMM